MFLRVRERLMGLLAALALTVEVILGFVVAFFFDSFIKAVFPFAVFRFVVCFEVLARFFFVFLGVCFFFLDLFLVAARLEAYFVVDRHFVVVTDFAGSLTLKTAKFAPLAEPPS